LKLELPGILNWALDGLRAWHFGGLNPPTEVRDATDKYRKESDLVGQWIEQRCIVGVDFKLRGGTAYADYGTWCAEVGLNKLSEINWSKRLQEKGFERYESVGRGMYRGIGLKEDKITV
jgi:putative DNA primase/helicase